MNVTEDEIGRTLAYAANQLSTGQPDVDRLRLRGRARRRRRAVLVVTSSVTASALSVALAVVVIARDTRDGTTLSGEGATSSLKDQWSELAPLPWPSMDVSAFRMDDGVVVVSGAGPDQERVVAASFDPRRNSWQEVPEAPLEWRVAPVVVSSGATLLVWGGANAAAGDGLNDGAMLDPQSKAWTALPRAPISGRVGASGVWTGDEFVIWGGFDVSGGSPRDGAAYDPEAQTWRRLSSAPIIGRNNHLATWTGKDMLLWGGCSSADPSCDEGGGDELTDGAAYDPETDRWRLLRTSILGPRDSPSAAWSGREWYVWGGILRGEYDTASYGAAYDPVLDRWRPLTPSPLSPRPEVTTAFVGPDWFVYGGASPEDGAVFLADAAVYRDGTGWRRLPDAPAGRRRAAAVVIGASIYLFGGCCDGGTVSRSTFRLHLGQPE